MLSTTATPGRIRDLLEPSLISRIVPTIAMENAMTSTQNQHHVRENSALEVYVVRIGRKRNSLFRECRETKRKKEQKRGNKNVVLARSLHFLGFPQVFSFHNSFQCGRSKHLYNLFSGVDILITIDLFSNK